MKRFRSPLLLALRFAVGFPIGWCLRGQSVAATEAALHNLVDVEKSKQQSEIEKSKQQLEAATNTAARAKP